MKTVASRTILILFLLVIGNFSLDAGGIAGDWRTIDDETGVTKSIVRITQSPDGAFEGRVIEILHSDRGPNPVCEKCPGDLRGKPIKGLVILWGLKATGDDEYKGGEILDPMKGKIYKARLKLLPDGRLEVRGFIGFSLIGRSQVWEPAS